MKPLPMPPPWSGPLPNANPPVDMALYQLPTGSYETRAAFAVKGGKFGDKRPFAATPALVMHPKGDLVIDAGFGSHVADHLATLPWYQRPPYTARQTVSAQLDGMPPSHERVIFGDLNVAAEDEARPNHAPPSAFPVPPVAFSARWP